VALLVLGPEAEHPLDRGALVFDRAVGAEHQVHVGRVLHERPEPLLAPTQVGHQHLLGQRPFAELAVLGGQAARGPGEREEQQREQRDRHRADDEQDVAAGLGDVGLDRRGVLVDLVSAEHAPVRAADRQVDREHPFGQPALELVLRVVACGELGLGLAVEDLLEVLL